jgi:hypothetical protein
MAGPCRGPTVPFGKLMEMPWLLLALDPYLIWFYRLPGNAYGGFLLGTFVLALISLVLSDATVSLASPLLGKHLDRVPTEAAKYQDLSIDAARPETRPHTGPPTGWPMRPSAILIIKENNHGIERNYVRHRREE